MSAPVPPRLTSQPPSGSGSTNPQRPDPTVIQPANNDLGASTATLRPDEPQGPSATAAKKRNNHRGGKKKKTTTKKKRRQSFAASNDDGSGMPETPHTHRGGNNPQSAARSSFYRHQGQNLSNTSIESEALLDHRYCMRQFPYLLQDG